MQCDTVYFVKMIIQIMEKSSKYKIQQCQNGFLIYDPAKTKQVHIKEHREFQFLNPMYTEGTC